ncbi:multicopper oxidase domain-containing protein, partial [Escherichia sp. R-CC3]
GRYLGPTIRVWKGDDVKLIYSNRLTDNVSMTVAGLQVPGPLMGGCPRRDSSSGGTGSGCCCPAALAFR